MPRSLNPNMSAQEFVGVRQESKPVDRYTLTFGPTDIELAIEFWLNNVVLRNPVTVEDLHTTDDGSVVIVAVPIVE